MSQRDPNTLLNDIVEYAQIALTLAKGRVRDDLDTDVGLRRALERALEVIWEAANHLDPAFCALHPEIPWRLLVGMRNRLVHGYADVDSDITWTTVNEDLPSLIESVGALLNSG